jgi:hypothetical protein
MAGTWKCGAGRKLDIVMRDSWDGQAAEDSIFAWAGWPDNPDPAKARKGFLAYDADAPELKGSYKLAFCMEVEGKLAAISAGLQAAASRLPQTDIPQDVADEARAVLDGYFAEMHKQQEQSSAPTIFAHPARVMPLVRSAEDMAQLVGLAKQRAWDPGVFDEAAPFIWPAEISSNRLDAYFTMMHVSSLRNYAQDAAAGVSFQNSHRTMQLGFGQSLTGRFEEAPDGTQRTLADFYTIPDLSLNDVNTNDFIRGVRAGLVRDVSIGFYGGQGFMFRCNICGMNMLSWECPHIPGFEYDVTDPQGTVTDRKLCFAWVQNARLAEVSAVYDGATPGAAILKAQQEADAGRLRPEAARLLEARYRIRLPGAREIYNGVSLSQPGAKSPLGARQERIMGQHNEEVTPAGGGGEPAPGTDLATEAVRVLVEVRQAMVGFQDVEDRPIADGVRWLADEVRRLAGEVQRLAPLADDGRAYRADLVAEAIGEGVRALGNGFAQETYRGILEAAPLETIKRMRQDWKAIGDARFPGGRLTLDRTEDPPRKTEPQANNAAFRGA